MTKEEQKEGEQEEEEDAELFSYRRVISSPLYHRCH